MTTLEKIWGKLFEEGKPTKRVGQLLRGIAVHLVSMVAVDWRNFAADSVKDPGGILKVSQSHQMRNKRLPDGAAGLGFHDDHKMTGQTKWVLPLAEMKGVSRHGTFPSFLRCNCKL
jgi:hypothetical protein